MLFFLGTTFLAGMLTVLAPCVLLLLPVIIGGSVSGNNKDYKRPIIITASLAVSLFLFTLLLKASSALIGVPPAVYTYISGIIIVLLGIVTFFPSLYARLIGKLGIEERAQKNLTKGYTSKRRYIGPIITGAALGPVFSSCSPVYAYIIATILPKSLSEALIYIVAYILGLSFLLLIIGFFGQRVISKLKFAADPRGWFQKAIAVLFIVVGLLIVTGLDKQLQTYVSTHTPFDIDGISKQLLPESKNKLNDNRLFNVEQPFQAAEFTGLSNWINAKPTTLDQLKGKVIYVDFWTYSCINCIRNNPYIEQWYTMYKDDGFTVIGVHAPEFAFEKKIDNVRKAVKDQGLTYPVALDNDFDTWNAYNNQSWPAGYLIDQDGRVVRIHEGEGNYKETEDAIRALLQKNNQDLPESTQSTDTSAPVTSQQTPETYLGLKRASNFAGSPALGASDSNTFTAQKTLDRNEWSLGGTWTVGQEKITAGKDASLQFNVAAKDVYVVAGSNDGSQQNMKLLVDGTPISQTLFSGSDVKNGVVTVNQSRLYRLVDFKKFTTNKTIELQVPSGVSLNAFTFGSM